MRRTIAPRQNKYGSALLLCVSHFSEVHRSSCFFFVLLFFSHNFSFFRFTGNFLARAFSLQFPSFSSGQFFVVTSFFTFLSRFSSYHYYFWNFHCKFLLSYFFFFCYFLWFLVYSPFNFLLSFFFSLLYSPRFCFFLFFVYFLFSYFSSLYFLRSKGSHREFFFLLHRFHPILLTRIDRWHLTCKYPANENIRYA